MREISFVKKLKFKFNGSVAKKALVIGDADNDQRNELVCANLQGDLAVFKDRNPDRYAYASDLGMVTACIIGDVINAGKNFVAAINTEGWLFIFDIPISQTTSPSCARGNNSPTCPKDESISVTPVAYNQHMLPHSANQDASRQFFTTHTSGQHPEVSTCPMGIRLTALYDQRMPANCKELLLADLDGDGQNEVIVGLTDRVLRTYKWIEIGPNRGKFVGLYKWEFADQIGAVSLNPSRHENCQDIIVAQPGGTYAKLECFDKKPTLVSNSTSSGSNEPSKQTFSDDSNKPSTNSIDSPNSAEDNVRTEYISKLTPEYHQLALAQMRNHHISTEILGGIRDGKNSNSYSLIVIATLDGTLMLVNKDEILWSLQVDHQLFALAKLESKTDSEQPMLSQSESTCTIVTNSELMKSSGNSRFCYAIKTSHNNLSLTSSSIGGRASQYFVVCAWNGKTYIVDEERNYLRFKFDEAVSAFTAGDYYCDGMERSSLVYATFNNQIVLYYDVILNPIRPVYLLNEIMNNPENEALLEKLDILANKMNLNEGENAVTNGDQRVMRLHSLLHDILYSLTDEQLSN